MNSEDSLGLSNSLLAFVAENEPVDTTKISKLIQDSELPEDAIKRAIERLHDAGLIKGHLINGLGSGTPYFVQALAVEITQKGLESLTNAVNEKKGDAKISLFPITVGKLNFNLDFNFLKV